MADDRFFTIGYEGFTQPALVARLKEAGVSLVVDVRDVANSRRAGFAKTSLRAALEEAGLRYDHLRALGTPKAGREANKRGDMAAFWPIVEASLAMPAAELALQELAALARAEPTAILCLENDWRRCHRARIASRLEAEHGLRAEHLAPDPAV